MITERIALIMLNGSVPAGTNDPHHTKAYYRSVESFAQASLKLYKHQRFTTLRDFLAIAGRMYREGNEIVRNGILNVYLFTLAKAFDANPESRKTITPFLPRELWHEYNRIHSASGM